MGMDARQFVLYNLGFFVLINQFSIRVFVCHNGLFNWNIFIAQGRSPQILPLLHLSSVHHNLILTKLTCPLVLTFLFKRK